jgi:hypothetical protein
MFRKPVKKRTALAVTKPRSRKHYVDIVTTYEAKHLTTSELSRGMVTRIHIDRAVFADHAAAAEYARATKKHNYELSVVLTAEG